MTTFDLLTALRAIAPRSTPSGARTTLDRDHVEILAGALLAHLEILDAHASPEVGSIVRIVSNDFEGAPDVYHALTVGSLALVTEVHGDGGIRAVGVNSGIWSPHAYGETVEQGLTTAHFEVVKP